MTKNTQKYCKIETTGFQDLCHRFGKLEDENKQLKKDNQLLSDELTYFKGYSEDLEEEVTRLKARCRELSCENHDLLVEIQDMKFTRKCLTSADAGKRFAQELLGGA